MPNPEILLVDDDEGALFIVRECIRQSLGCRITALPDPIKALAVFNANPDRFQMLITDFCMPGMTGEELTQQILAQRPDMPVIGISGTPNKYQHPEAFAELLPKPFEMPDLEAAVSRHLTGKCPPRSGLPTFQVGQNGRATG